MNIRLHANATTTPKIRRYIQRSEKANREFAEELGIALSTVRHPQTKGMVERFNGRISEVLATHRLDSRQDLATTLKHHCYLYNHCIPQKALSTEHPSRPSRSGPTDTLIRLFVKETI